MGEIGQHFRTFLLQVLQGRLLAFNCAVISSSLRDSSSTVSCSREENGKTGGNFVPWSDTSFQKTIPFGPDGLDAVLQFVIALETFAGDG